MNQWEMLYNYLVETPIPGVSLEKTETSYRLTEVFNGRLIFSYDRFLDGGRSTNVDLIGFIGLSSLTFKGPIYITEGVSDFITVKLLTGGDVLGKTTLRLSQKQINVFKELRRPIVDVADNDVTGLAEVLRNKIQLTSSGLSYKMVVPSPYKDITKAWIEDPQFAANLLKV